MTDEFLKEILDYYTRPGPITDLGSHHAFAEWLADDLRAIVVVVQGLLVHDGWLGSYGIEFNEAQRYDRHGIGMAALLDKAAALDGRSLAIPRAPENRVIGCCREFSTLLAAFLRAKGIPACSRCGFAAYFDSTAQWEDHWVCEYWRADETRWVLVDPQMDPFQQSTLALPFSPLDIPRTQFLSGGEAWKRCRDGTLRPEDFGIGGDPTRYDLTSLRGQWFVRGNLLRDVASLNKVETVPLLLRLARGLSWTPWRLVGAADDELAVEDLHLLDRVAELASAPDAHFSALRALYDTTPDLRPPVEILQYR
jgi:hypothetical protein